MDSSTPFWPWHVSYHHSLTPETLLEHGLQNLPGRCAATLLNSALCYNMTTKSLFSGPSASFMNNECKSFLLIFISPTSIAGLNKTLGAFFSDRFKSHTVPLRSAAGEGCLLVDRGAVDGVGWGYWSYDTPKNTAGLKKILPLVPHQKCIDTL